METKRTLLHIGGGPLQLPGLRWAAEVGLEVVLTDVDPAAPGRAIAARVEPIAGDDVPAQVALAAELAGSGAFAGAYCSNDFGLHSVAAVGARTGTPANSPGAVRAALDKGRSAEIWRDAGVLAPRGRVIASLEEAHAAFAELGVPAILKPVGSSGSRGVRRVRSSSELAPAWARARTHGERARVEEHCAGRHFDVNALWLGGRFVRCGLLERFFGPPPACVPLWGVQPPELAAKAAERIWKLVERAARALELCVGPLKADVIWTERGPLVLEVAPRFHGDVSTGHVTPLCAGSSPIRAWFAHLAAPEEPAGWEPHWRGAAGWTALLPERCGVFAGGRGEDAAREVPGVARVEWIKRPGARIAELEDNRAVCGFLWASGRDARAVRTALEAARACIEVRNE
jgi:biotin carboxylase